MKLKLNKPIKPPTMASLKPGEVFRLVGRDLVMMVIQNARTLDGCCWNAVAIESGNLRGVTDDAEVEPVCGSFVEGES